MKNNNQTPLSEKKIAELINREAIKRVIEQNRKFAEAVGKLKEEVPDLEFPASNDHDSSVHHEINKIFGEFKSEGKK